jgi:hypothetical protein
MTLHVEADLSMRSLTTDLQMQTKSKKFIYHNSIRIASGNRSGSCRMNRHTFFSSRGGSRRLSESRHARQGSAALLLIFLLFIPGSCCPLATALIRTAYSQVQILRAGASLMKTLAQTSLCRMRTPGGRRLEIRAIRLPR